MRVKQLREFAELSVDGELPRERRDRRETEMGTDGRGRANERTTNRGREEGRDVGVGEV